MDNSTLDFDAAFHGPSTYSLRLSPHRPSPPQRQRSHRVFKPFSTGNSPRHPRGRRSTLAADYSQTMNVCRARYQQWQSPLSEKQSPVTTSCRSRPTSWHPSSHINRSNASSQPAQPSYFPEVNVPDFLMPSYSFTTAQVNGLITPLSQPCYGEPFNQEALSSLDDPSQPYPDPYAFLDEFRAETDPEYSAKYSPSSTTPYRDIAYNPFEHKYQQDHQVYMSQQQQNTAPPSPTTTLPKQEQPEEDTALPLLSKIASTADELVGMGIYDPPSPPTDSFLFGGGCGKRTSVGKGLILEETFEPDPVEDDDDDDEEKDGEGEDEDKEQDEEEQERGPHHIGAGVGDMYMDMGERKKGVEITTGGWI